MKGEWKGKKRTNKKSLQYCCCCCCTRNAEILILYVWCGAMPCSEWVRDHRKGERSHFALCSRCVRACVSMYIVTDRVWMWWCIVYSWLAAVAAESSVFGVESASRCCCRARLPHQYMIVIIIMVLVVVFLSLLLLLLLPFVGLSTALVAMRACQSPCALVYRRNACNHARRKYVCAASFYIHHACMHSPDITNELWLMCVDRFGNTRNDKHRKNLSSKMRWPYARLQPPAATASQSTMAVAGSANSGRERINIYIQSFHTSSLRRCFVRLIVPSRR